MNGLDITVRPRNMWIVDFGEMNLEEAKLFSLPFSYVEKNVKPSRDENNDLQRKTFWWRLGRSGGDLKAAKKGLSRIIVTPRVSKHRLFVWADPELIPDSAIVAITKDDNYFFGLLHSTLHELWARSTGTQLREAESGFRYTPTSTFETFPFPWPPGTEPKDDPRVQAIAAAAKYLDDFRTGWLHPPVVEIGVTISEKMLQKRTLTNLYNALTLYREQFKGRSRQPSAWDEAVQHLISLGEVETLDHVHTTLDHAVLDAYGWPHNLSEEGILERLLALNLERAKG